MPAPAPCASNKTARGDVNVDVNVNVNEIRSPVRDGLPGANESMGGGSDRAHGWRWFPCGTTFGGRFRSSRLNRCPPPPRFEPHDHSRGKPFRLRLRLRLRLRFHAESS